MGGCNCDNSFVSLIMYFLLVLYFLLVYNIKFFNTNMKLQDLIIKFMRIIEIMITWRDVIVIIHLFL